MALRNDTTTLLSVKTDTKTVATPLLRKNAQGALLCVFNPPI